MSTANELLIVGLHLYVTIENNVPQVTRQDRVTSLGAYSETPSFFVVDGLQKTRYQKDRLLKVMCDEDGNWLNFNCKVLCLPGQEAEAKSRILAYIKERLAAYRRKIFLMESELLKPGGN